MRLIRFSFCLVLLIGVFCARAQEQTCEQTLNDAQAEFDAGRFYGLPAMLKKCLEGGFTSEQRFRAYYILTQAYLVLDDPIAAEDSYLKLLKVNPEFRASIANDPVDLYYLSKKFTSRPRFTPHYRLGLNASFPSTLANVSTYAGSTENSSGLRIGFPMLGAGIDFNINDNWAIGGEANFAPKTYTLAAKGIFGADDISIVERISGFDFPIYIKYQKDSGRLRPFGYAGFAFNLLLSSSATIVSNDRFLDGRTTPSQGPDVDMLYSRNTLNRSLVLGGGVKYKVGKNFVYADLRYMLGLNNMVIPDRNFYRPDGQLAESVTTYGYVTEFFRLDNLSLSFGFVMPIYDPRRLKKVNANGFLQKFPWIKKKANKK